MRPGRGRALAIWGATISATGHAAAIGLAVWALPWLSAGPDPGVPVVRVQLVDPAALDRPAVPDPPAALIDSGRPAVATQAPPASPEPPPTDATVPHDAPVAAPELPEAPEAGLAGRFDPGAALGLDVPRGDAADAAPAAAPDFALPSLAGRTADPARPPEPEAAEEEVGPATVQAFGAEVLAAVERAKVFPRRARERGLFGTSRVALTIGPGGELTSAHLVRSSGAKALDDAALAAVRNAELPAPPWGAPVAYDLGISFTLHGN